MYDPFAELSEPPDRPRYQRAGDGRYYYWDYKKLLRVSAVLDQASGHGLVKYAGEQAALRAAASLVHAGLYIPNSETLSDARLETFVDGEAIRLCEADQWPPNVTRLPGMTEAQAWAVYDAAQWQSNSIESERYRDHKGRVGSIQHLATQARFMGTLPPGDLLEAIMPMAYDLVRPLEGMLARYATLGKSIDDVAIDLAHHALPHVRAGLDWVDRYRPEPHVLGTECVVMDQAAGCAGTRDLLADFRKDIWESADGKAWPFGDAGSKAKLSVDYKNSNKLSGSVRFQIAAYAVAPMIANYDDYSEHPNPESDGLLALHITPEGASMRHWSRAAIEPFADAFYGLLIYARAIGNLPMAIRERKASPAKEKKGERACRF